MGFDEALAAIRDRLGAALLAERERWILWLPVAVGSGVAIYFDLPEEPPRWIGPLLFAAAVIAGIALRRRTIPLIASIGIAAASIGFTLACERTAAVSAPVLARPAVGVDLSGRILGIEPLESGQRLTLDRIEIPLRDGGPRPSRVRIRLPARSAADLQPGQRIAIRATLLPLPMPAAPGAYDFQRQAWFLGIGAVGYALGEPRAVGTPPPQGWAERLGVAVARARHALAQRIGAAIAKSERDPGAAPVAQDLVTGERGAVPPDILQGYRDAGLAHILVIAGMHMSMVAGLVFVAVRGLLAVIPWIALRYPIKKWTALIALLVMAGYLVISGGSVPTQRAFIMNAIIMLAILFDREAISLRTISWAALVVLALEPEALVGPSFQLSFAAVYALISAYEALTPRLLAWRRDERLGWGTAVALYVGGIMLTTLVAGGATAFYTVYHFNRYSSYALLGNLLAVPVVGFWVMPAALLAMILLPFGLDGWGWWLMGHGIAVVNRIAEMTSHLPGAALDLPSMPPMALIVFTLGGLWLCLWRQRWRRYGLVGMALGIAIAALHRPPDLIVDVTGRMAALRGADGHLVFAPARGDRRAKETWAQMAGQGTKTPVWTDADKVLCDSQGCVWRAPGGIVALARMPDAVVEDCQAADLVIVPVPMFAPCPSATLVLDGLRLRRGGTHAIWLDGSGDQPRVLTVAEWQGRRPWSTAPQVRRPKPSVSNESGEAETVGEGEGASTDAAAPPDDPEP